MAVLDVNEVVQALHAVRNEWRDAQKRSREPGGRELPSRDALAQIVEQLKGALFPMRLGPPDLRHESEDFYVGHTLDAALQALLQQARLELAWGQRHAPLSEAALDEQVATAVREFASALPGIRRLLDSDVLAAFQGDPAARSVDEVLLCYPGILAMIHHRLAHQLYRLDLPLLARIVAELAHGQTGIDIHPGAQIGDHFFIDHGTGIVVGETTIIGDNVKLYQGATLGALSPAGMATNPNVRRHPKVGNNVVIYANSTLLGGATEIGDNVVVGGNAFLTSSVAPNTVVSVKNPEMTFRGKHHRG